MDFNLSDQQLAFQELAKTFAEQALLPFAAEWDKSHTFPVDTLRSAAKLGFAGLNVSETFGGSALSRLDSTLVFEMLATGCPSTAAYLSIHNMVCWLIDQYGDNTLRETWLPQLTTMNLFGSYCLTEPSAGSDAASLKTTAKRDGDHYIVNGSKAFISGGGASDLYLCMVRTGDQGPDGISCLLIEKDREGISFGKQEQKLGWHSQPTAMVFFENCRVPISHRLGEENQGFKMALQALNGGRVNIAACSLGGALFCLEQAGRYLTERVQFKKPLVAHQTVQFTLADLWTDYEAARLLVLRAAHSLDTQHPRRVSHAAMAKRLATDSGFHIANEVLQRFGGYGFLSDYPIERVFRDLRAHPIVEGTNDIMRLLIAREYCAI